MSLDICNYIDINFYYYNDKNKHNIKDLLTDNLKLINLNKELDKKGLIYQINLNKNNDKELIESFNKFTFIKKVSYILNVITKYYDNLFGDKDNDVNEIVFNDKKNTISIQLISKCYISCFITNNTTNDRLFKIKGNLIGENPFQITFLLNEFSYKNNNPHKCYCSDCQYEINNQINNIITPLGDYVYKILYERKVFI